MTPRADHREGKGESRGADWVSFPDALAAVLAGCRPLPSVTRALDESLGRALREDVRSEVDHPPWDNSAMDGFAVRAADVAGAGPDRPVMLPVAGEVPAGGFPEGPLRPGTAVKVMTGAPVPEGATGVIRVEHTDGGAEGRVSFFESSDAERNIRSAGEDVRQGDLLLRAGEEIAPAAVGVLALTGRRRLQVGRRPRVGILTNGDELATFEEFEAVRAGRRIMDTNGPALAAQVRAAGAVPVPLGIARDDPADLRRRLERRAECDALVSAAGVSVGERDHLRSVLEEEGLRRAFWRVRVRPGSALAFGSLEGKPWWGLPGNPVSALVGFEVFVRPGLRRLAGHVAVHRAVLRARLAEPLESKEGLTHFYRVRLREASDGPPWARTTGPQGSGILTSMVAADALLIVPEDAGRLERGATADAIPLRSWRPEAEATEPWP